MLVFKEVVEVVSVFSESSKVQVKYHDQGSDNKINTYYAYLPMAVSYGKVGTVLSVEGLIDKNKMVSIRKFFIFN